MYMKAPKQKNAKHVKIEIKKIESQKKNKSCNATVKKKAKATRNDYNIIYSTRSARSILNGKRCVRFFVTFKDYIML